VPFTETESTGRGKTVEIRFVVSLLPFVRNWEPAPGLTFQADVKKIRVTSGLRFVGARRRAELDLELFAANT
jgi:hypothetical protein